MRRMATNPDERPAMTAITADTRVTDLIERIPCHRCEGSGYVRGFGHVNNGVCFRCHGSGGRDTETGAAIRAEWRRLHTMPAEWARPGDRLHLGWGVGARWQRLTGVTRDGDRITLATANGTHTMPADSPVRVAPQGATVLPILRYLAARYLDR